MMILHFDMKDALQPLKGRPSTQSVVEYRIIINRRVSECIDCIRYGRRHLYLGRCCFEMVEGRPPTISTWTRRALGAGEDGSWDALTLFGLNALTLFKQRHALTLFSVDDRTVVSTSIVSLCLTIFAFSAEEIQIVATEDLMNAQIRRTER